MFLRKSLFFSLALLCMLSPAAQAAPVQDKLTQAVDAAIDAALAEKRIAGAVVLVSYDGKTVYHRAAGYADVEAQRPVQENTIFRLASVTKAYTSMAAATLVQQGKLSFDDPVTKWLPNFTPALANGTVPEIKIRHLMAHTAGLQYKFGEQKKGPYHRANISDGLDLSGVTLEENLQRIASVPLLFAPGKKMNYSLATDVLGAVVAKAHGTTFQQAMQELVLDPLGMRDATFVVRDTARLATPYRNTLTGPRRMKDTEVAWNIEFAPKRILDAAAYPSGGAGMAATAADVLRLLETVRTGGGSLASPEIIKQMNTNQIGSDRVSPGLAFGLGWAVLLDPKMANTPQAAGTLSWGGVYGNNWFVDPTNKLTVVILTNTALEGMSGKITQDVRDAVYSGLSLQ